MSRTDASAETASAYDTIVGTLAATERGRAFLAEHARRSRAEGTKVLLDAISRLDQRLDEMRRDGEQQVGPRVDVLDGLFRQMEKRLGPDWTGSDAQARPALPDARDLAGIICASTAAIGEGVEGIQDTAWLMREAGFDAELCDRLDDHAAAIGLACSRCEAASSVLDALAQSDDARAGLVAQGYAERAEPDRTGDDSEPLAPPAAAPRTAP